MVNETLARRYATAIYELAQESQSVDAVGSDLKAIAAALDGDESLRNFFVSPVVDRNDKERALTAAFQSRVNVVALHALLLLVRKRREAILAAVASEYAKIVLQARGVEAMTVTTARPLPEAELRALVERLERTYGRTFDVRVKHDPNLIGGVRVAMGDRLIDGTVAGRLEELSRTLFATN